MFNNLILLVLTLASMCYATLTNESEMAITKTYLHSNEEENNFNQAAETDALRTMLIKYFTQLEANSENKDEEYHEKREYEDDGEYSYEPVNDEDLAKIDEFLKQNIPHLYENDSM